MWSDTSLYVIISLAKSSMSGKIEKKYEKVQEAAHILYADNMYDINKKLIKFNT